MRHYTLATPSTLAPRGPPRTPPPDLPCSGSSSCGLMSMALTLGAELNRPFLRFATDLKCWTNSALGPLEVRRKLRNCELQLLRFRQNCRTAPEPRNEEFHGTAFCAPTPLWTNRETAQLRNCNCVLRMPASGMYYCTAQ